MLFSLSPPIDTIKIFLNIQGLKDGCCQVRIDQWGELSRGTKFRKTILDACYTLKRTGAGAFLQNRFAKRPHCTLADMMYAMLA